MRDAKQKAASPQAGAKKNILSGVAVVNERPDADALAPLPGRPEAQAGISPETGPQPESGTGRFDPDLILGTRCKDETEGSAAADALPETGLESAEEEETLAPVESAAPSGFEAIGQIVGPQEAEISAQDISSGDKTDVFPNADARKATIPAVQSGRAAESSEKDDAAGIDAPQAEAGEPLSSKPPQAGAPDAEHAPQGENPKNHWQGQSGDTNANDGEAGFHAPKARAGAGNADGAADKTAQDAPQFPKTADAGENPQDRTIAAGMFAEARLPGAETQSVAVASPQVYTLSSGDKFGEGLLRVIDIVKGGDASEARIVVEPPALGRIDVSLKSSSNGVEAMFRVDNEELRQMVQNQLDSLKDSLQAQGIHVYALSVDI
ncbi:MAG: flagellar hook-length control protein FliK, partial [Synergistaceae bacterium]|nr:flagellar hook-length control protein FliK [Synergistaceae bacterium]